MLSEVHEWAMKERQQKIAYESTNSFFLLNQKNYEKYSNFVYIFPIKKTVLVILS